MIMTSITHEPMAFTNETEISLLSELLEAEQARLLIGIRHTFRREYRDELHRRLNLIESLMNRGQHQA